MKGIDTMNKLTYSTTLEFAICAIQNGQDKWHMAGSENEYTKDEVAAKLIALRDSLAKKASGDRKPTAQEQENEGVRRSIVEFLAERPSEKFTITELMAQVPGLPEQMSNQRMNTLIMHLLPSYGDGKTGTGEVVRVQDKRKTYFQIAP